MVYGLDKDKLGRQMKAAREKKGLSVIEAAAKAGTAEWVVYKLEKGILNPTLNWLHRYCVALEIRMEFVLWE